LPGIYSEPEIRGALWRFARRLAAYEIISDPNKPTEEHG